MKKQVEKIKQMLRVGRFKAKLMLYYALVIGMIFLVIGFVVYEYNAHVVTSNAENDLSQKSHLIAQQLEFTIKEMESVVNVISANTEIVDAMPVVNTKTWSKMTDKNLLLETSELRTAFLNAVYNMAEAYRVTIFNANGDTISTRAVDVGKSEIVKSLAKNDYYAKLPVVNDVAFWGPHYDPWVVDQHIQVFSILKPIRSKGIEIGWIEVAQRVTKLQQISSLRNENSVNVAILDKDGKVVYSTWKLLNKTLLHHYNDLIGKPQDVIVAVNPISKLNEIIAYDVSQVSDFRVLSIQNERDVENSLQLLKLVIVLVFLIMILSSLMLFSLFVNRLTKPLQSLTKEMEEADVGVLPTDGKIEQLNAGVNEIDALHKSFRAMMKRLDSSIKSEVESRSLQLRARLDALQARINPHFLFNMLGVMVNIAEENGDDEVAQVSRKLAKLLRYSTQSTKTVSTIAEEINHCQDYMFLMKKRFEDRIGFELDVDEAIWGVKLPQLIIQPLVENAVMHGYNHSLESVMKIRVVGEADGNRWRIRVIDNGTGFDEEKLNEINAAIDRYATDIIDGGTADDAGIGGMGLINTFARLALFSSGQIQFSIENCGQNGACVSIEGTMSPQDGGEGAESDV